MVLRPPRSRRDGVPPFVATGVAGLAPSGRCPSPRPPDHRGDELLGGFTTDLNGALAARASSRPAIPSAASSGRRLRRRHRGGRAEGDRRSARGRVIVSGASVRPPTIALTRRSPSPGRDLAEMPQLSARSGRWWPGCTPPLGPEPDTRPANRRMARMATRADPGQPPSMAPPLAIELERPRPVALRPPGVPREFEAVPRRC